MANWTQEDGAPKPVTNPADVSTIAQISSVNIAGGVSAPVPCLIPSFADAVKLLSARYSCLVLDSHRRHIALPPQYLRKKRTGIQEELNAELLRFSSSLKGVPMAYDNIKVVGQHGDIHDDQGFIHFNIEASFVVFKPKKGSKLVGVINKMGVGHVGCLVHGCFNASVVKPSLLSSEQWRDSGLSVGQNLEFEVFQLDADTAGVLLIRGRLEKSRVQELVAQTEQMESTVESTTEPEPTEDTIDSAKPKKKKKKDKREKESQNDRGLEQTSENHQTAADTAEIDSNANGHHKEKKRKKKDRRQESDEILPSELSTSDFSRYVSDKTSRKRAAESNDGLQDVPAAKKKKKSK
ncbi:DNA-directed RNA polymerase I subunit RPA43-like [Sinocyclocheilus anshuiensis]|uniref:DNA-directed RNA polymerase subunit n=1 Tax=Sinocyclocheilus anshuiensis TaxID=1608454 RepID=A0A671RRT5_9TELE|nr:PREDICTED: DNA-directed RNA polymerase I subunit RPA43-like [Sinocyclocheilus anshuiensis]